MTDTQTEYTPAGVPPRATQAGEVRTRWAWTEPTVWTERMLTALEEGVKGGVWFSLSDKVSALRTLRAAWQHVKANDGAAGVDQVTVAMYERDVERNLAQVSQQLRDGTYRPQPVRRTWIDKPGSREQRPLGIPTVRDRIVQTALRLVLEPIFERHFAAQSYGFRPGRGCKDALRRVDALLTGGYTWVVDADLRSYFDSIPHQPLLAGVRRHVADGRVLALLEQFLTQGVMDGLEAWTPDEGTPQGAVVSPLLANIYLDPLDHDMAAVGFEMVRYADDFVVLCRSGEEAQAALAEVKAWVEGNGLSLSPDKTHVGDCRQEGQGFEFLGYRFEAGRRWVRRKSFKAIRERIRMRTKRTRGDSLARIIADLNPTLRGWFNYFKHAHPMTFSGMDGFVRRRLRAILRKQEKRPGMGRCRDDHQRWPNTFFATQGLFTMVAARELASQSR